MSEKTQGYLYIAVCAACIITCAVLIASMIFGSPSERMEEDHSPQIPQSMTHDETLPRKGEMLVTQEYAAAVIEANMPSELPISDVRVKVEKAGAITISGAITREDFSRMLENAGASGGIKEWAFLKIMGKKATMEAEFSCKTGEDGMVMLAPTNIKINKMEINLESLPSQYFEKVSAALNETLHQTGFIYSSIELRDGAIVLIA